MQESVNSEAFLELDPAEWKQIIDVNLMGVYYVTRAVLPQLIEKMVETLSIFHPLLVKKVLPLQVLTALQNLACSA